MPITTGAVGVPAGSLVGGGVTTTVGPVAASWVAAVLFSVSLSSWVM